MEAETEVTGDFFDVKGLQYTLVSAAVGFLVLCYFLAWLFSPPYRPGNECDLETSFVPFLFWFDVMQCLWRIRGNSNSSFIPHFLSSKPDNCFLPRKDKIPEPLLLLNSILLSLLSGEPPHNYYSLHETLPLDFLFFYLFLWIRE